MSSVEGVEALLFDVFGTVVNWRQSVTELLQEQAKTWKIGRGDEDWDEFAREWRAGYMRRTREIAQGAEGSTNIDIVHRELLDTMLDSPKWTDLSAGLNDAKRHELTLNWHKLKGWDDTTAGLYALKKQAIIATLSNGAARLLIDLAKFADLPWDAIFSGDILGSYKPNPKMYLGAAERLAVSPDKCLMVAAHIYDLKAAESYGMKTAYVRRVTEDTEEIRSKVTLKSDPNGDPEFKVDIVVDSFLELADVLQKAKAA
ncbi:HAD-like hydrolase superfamily protein [Abortiporus biennis]